MEIDSEYLTDVVSYLKEHLYQRLCFPHNGKTKFWWNDNSECFPYIVVDVAPENIPKFIAHLKHIIDLRDPLHPQVEFKDDTLTEFKVMGTWEDEVNCRRWVNLSDKQKGLSKH